LRLQAKPDQLVPSVPSRLTFVNPPAASGVP
jgi:hypothetical protein